MAQELWLIKGVYDMKEIIDARLIEPNAPVVTDEDVTTPEEQVTKQKQIAEFISSMRVKVQSSMRAKVHPTEETAKFSRKYQNRSKYLGNGSLREAA